MLHLFKEGWEWKILISSTKHFHMESIFSHIPENVFVIFLNETLILEWLFISQSLLSLLLCFQSDPFHSILFSCVSLLQTHHRAKFAVIFHRHEDFPSQGCTWALCSGSQAQINASSNRVWWSFLWYIIFNSETYNLRFNLLAIQRALFLRLFSQMKWLSGFLHHQHWHLSQCWCFY